MSQSDRGWEAEDQWGRCRYYWVPFNKAFGTWYRLECTRKGMSSDVKVASGKGASVMVQPDLEKGRWYWSVRVGLTQKTKEPVRWGTTATAEEGMAAARDALMNWDTHVEPEPEEIAWT